MIIHDQVEQGTEEWHALRAGVPTSSNFGKILKANGKPSESVKGYIHQLVGEKLLGHTEDGYKNDAMKRGNELEPEARELYEFTQEATVDQVGFISLESPRCGCSPDGLIGNDGGLEIKCPSLAVHVKYLLGGKLPAEYHRQVHGSLYVTQRKWWDFMSYYPGIDPFIIRVYPDRSFQRHLEEALEKINIDIENAYQALKGE